MKREGWCPCFGGTRNMKRGRMAVLFRMDTGGTWRFYSDLCKE